MLNQKAHLRYPLGGKDHEGTSYIYFVFITRKVAVLSYSHLQMRKLKSEGGELPKRYSAGSSRILELEGLSIKLLRFGRNNITGSVQYYERIYE